MEEAGFYETLRQFLPSTRLYISDDNTHQEVSCPLRCQKVLWAIRRCFTCWELVHNSDHDQRLSEGQQGGEVYGGPAGDVVRIGKQGTLRQGAINYRLQEYDDSSPTGQFRLKSRDLSSRCPLKPV